MINQLKQSYNIVELQRIRLFLQFETIEAGFHQNSNYIAT